MSSTIDGTAAGGSRMALRRERRRRRRRAIAAALALLVLLTVVVTVVLARRDEPPAPVTAAPTRTQRTLLFELQAPNGTAAAAALLADDPASGSGAVVLLPPQTLVTVPSAGSLTISRALPRVPPEGSRAAVADALGVTVDAGWVLDQPSLQALVDALGGIRVDVDTDVERGGRLVLQQGSQQLDGLSTLAYATYLAPGEQEQARLARLQAVLDGLLGALPDDVQQTTELLRTLPRSVSSLPVDRLAQFLADLDAADADTLLQYDTLPVVPIDAGGAVTFRVDDAATRTLVDRLLAGSVPPGARDARNRVLVLNGVGTPGLAEQVRARLVPAGFTYVGSRNAAAFGYARTQVLVPDATPASQALGARVSKALGLGTDAVRTSDQLGTVADVIVLVGRDFRAS